MNSMTGLRALTLSYLGEDWDLFGSTIDEALVAFVHESDGSEVAGAVAGLTELLATSLSDQEYAERWAIELHSGYDPRDDGLTFREWFAHARDLLVAEAARRDS